MKRELALQLLNSILPNPPWDEEQLQMLFSELGVLAEHKYNQYEMYQPGRLFFENLYLWLTEFKEEDRTIALELVRRNLIFISREEFQQLAQTLYYDQIYQRQLDLTATRAHIPRHLVRQLSGSTFLRNLQRSSLYVAMSDGARIDYFRRQNLSINNEQVLTTYYPNEEKVRGIVNDLEKNLGVNSRFECLFLLDDFCGSGRTLLREIVRVHLSNPLTNFTVPPHLAAYLRYKADKQDLELVYSPAGLSVSEDELLSLHTESVYLDSVRLLTERHHAGQTELIGSLMRITESSLFEALSDEVQVFLCPLLATEYAVQRLQSLTQRLPKPLNGLAILPGTTIPNEVRITPMAAGKEGLLNPIAALCENNYTDELEDEHTGNIKYGYDACGLPVVLHHNTPNNSIYILWSRKWRNPLFVRYERHGREAV
jgi:hypothetical protein